jgi:holo-[acyl-carrier protein] synthase
MTVPPPDDRSPSTMEGAMTAEPDRRSAGRVFVGIGLDIVDTERFRQVLSRRPRLADRLFTDEERADLAERSDPVPSLAARFAVKEATMKALGVGLGAFGWHEVEIRRLRSGAPRLGLSGAAADLSACRGVKSWEVTISHTALVAAAVVVALGQ